MRGWARPSWHASCVGREICTLVLLVYNAHWLSDVFVTHLTTWINVFRLSFPSLVQIFRLPPYGGGKIKLSKIVGFLF